MCSSDLELFEHPDYATAEARAKNRAPLNALLNEAFAKKPTDEWVAILNKAGVPCGPIYRMDQVFADAQAKHIGAAAEVAHPRLGTLRLINQPVKLSRTPAKLAAATPERGQHTTEVLRELGYSDTKIDELKKKGIL